MGTATGRARRAAALAAAVLLAWAAAQAQERPLRVGIDRSYPPFQFVDAKGRPAGFDVELFESVAQHLGLRYELVVRDWPEIRAGLESGELDASPGVFRTPARDPLLGFSVPTAWVHHTVFVRDGSPIASARDLQGRRVLVARSGPHDDLLGEQIPGVELIRTDTSEDALRRLAGGDADAAVALDVLGLWVIRTIPLAGVRSLGEPLDEMQLRFAVPRDRESLLALLNDGITELRESGAYDRIYDRWFGVLQSQGVPLGKVIWGAAALAAVAALALGWSALLRRAVDRRTRDLLRSQADKRGLEQQLLQIEKTEALSRLASGVAGDFDALLAAILTNLRLARAAESDATARGRALDAVETAVRTAAALVEQLFLYGGSEPGVPRLLAWNEIVREYEPLARRLLPPGVRLAIHLAPESGLVRLDPEQARQLVANLVLNARDRLEGAGAIDVATSLVFRDGAWWSVLEVRDDGPALDAASLDRIFDPFFTKKGRGTGLALATIHVIVSRAGGRIEAGSEPGAGSSFVIRLPAAS